MSEPDRASVSKKKGKCVSFEVPITTVAGPSSSSAASTGAVRVFSTQDRSQTATHSGAIPRVQVSPTQLAELPIYRPVSNVYRGPRSTLQAGFRAVSAPTSFSEHINQTNNIVHANARGRPLLQPEHITPVDVASASAHNSGHTTMGIASACNTPWISDVDGPLHVESLASKSDNRDSPDGEFPMYGTPNEENQALNYEESRYEADEDTHDFDQDDSSNSGSSFDRPVRTMQEPAASSSSYRDDPLDELRYLMYENRASAVNGHATQSFTPAVPSNTQPLRPALSSTTRSFGPSLSPTTLATPPRLPIIRPSASIYRHGVYPAATYIASDGSSAGSSSSRSTPYMGSGSFAPRYTAPDPYARTSGLSRPVFVAENHGFAGSFAHSVSQLGSGLTNSPRLSATASGHPSSTDQNRQGNIYSGHNAERARDENDENHFRMPGQVPNQQNPFHHGPHQQYLGHQSPSMGYSGGGGQHPSGSGVYEGPSLMHAHNRQGNRHRQGIRFREPSRNRQVFQNRPRTPYTPAPSPSAYLLYEDPPGTVIPDNEGLNPYELRDREAAADALLRLNSEDEEEVDLILERLHSRRRRLENEAQALRLEQEEDRVWSLLDEKEAKKTQLG